MKLSTTQRTVLNRAASRPSGCICPTPGLWAGAQTAVLAALERKGYIIDARTYPVITATGRAAALAPDDLEPVPEPFARPSRRIADRIDGYDRDDLGESPDC